MGHLPSRWNLFALLLAVGTLVGCQGISSGNPASQGTQPDTPAGALSAVPASVSFGNVSVGTSQSQLDTLSNTGGTSLTIAQVSVSGAAFSVSGLSLPLTLVPNQSSSFSVVFTPTAAGQSNGDLSISISGSSSTVDIAVSGTGVVPSVPATLTASPASLTFTGAQVGTPQTQNLTIQNTGGSSATVSQVSVTGASFSVSGISTPITLASGQSTSLSVSFAPQSSGSFAGSVAIVSNASDSNLTISLSGTASGSTQGQLSISPITINNGNVTVGTSGSQTATLTATSASVVVSSVDVGSVEFVVSGLSFPATIGAGQSASFTVTFTPQSSGLATAGASFVSNASNSPTAATFTGTGVAAPVYSVLLAWNVSTSPNIIGYNIYRRTGASGSYSQINTVVDPVTTYTDTSVVDGQTYYYEITAVNSNDEESAASTAVQAVIPSP